MENYAVIKQLLFTVVQLQRRRKHPLIMMMKNIVTIHVQYSNICMTYFLVAVFGLPAVLGLPVLGLLVFGLALDGSP